MLLFDKNKEIPIGIISFKRGTKIYVLFTHKEIYILSVLYHATVYQ